LLCRDDTQVFLRRRAGAQVAKGTHALAQLKSPSLFFVTSLLGA